VKEARITINGRDLMEGQSMTVRVAITSFAADLLENGLGDDDHGKKMTAAYLERIGELNALLFSAHST
jgi:hypothetical protein